jgi:2,3-bisphosphoglycerate-independent phosphoglycerate mutase
MKYVVLILDGASGWPVSERDGRTCLEMARTPNLDALAGEGTVGLVRTVPEGMEPSSACACMSLLGYDPRVYFRGRGAIEARSLGIPIEEGEVVFRCNLVAVRDGKMLSYSTGYIPTEEAHILVEDLNDALGTDQVRFYPGVSYRHILRLSGHEDSLLAECTPPHDIPGRPIADFFPRGTGSRVLSDLMKRSEAVLAGHPVNLARQARGDLPAAMIWLFWGSGPLPPVPAFSEVYGLEATMTSGVDLLNGLARILGMDVLDIDGVTDGQDNDYPAQGAGAVAALARYDLVVVHIEAPDEAAHDHAIDDKIAAIQNIDRDVVGPLRARDKGDLRLLVLPDHHTPIQVQTHTDDPVPFLLWGPGFTPSGAKRFTEAEAKSTGLFLPDGYKIMDRLLGGIE